MSDPNNKLDFSAISFDSVVGDGAEGLETVEEVQNAEPIDDDIEQEVESVDEDPREYGDEDQEDYVDEEYDEDEEDLTVEDDYDDDEEVELEEGDLTISDQISEVLGVEMEYEYADTVEGLTNYVRDVSEEVAEAQIQDLFDEFPEVQRHLEYVLAGETRRILRCQQPIIRLR